MVKQQGAIVPLSHRLDTSLRLERPKHNCVCESASHVRMSEAGRHENVGSMRMHGVELKWYALHTVQQRSIELLGSRSSC